jgi:hypothetical protein
MTLDEIAGQLPIDDIAARLGVDRETAQHAVELALPTLVGGMQANAQDPAASRSLAGALGQHDNSLLDAVLGDQGLDAVDTDDGDQIVRHVFGGKSDQVLSQLGSTSGVGGGLVAKLLPMLAPIVMSYLAKQLFGGGRAAAAGRQDGGTDGGGGLADILGQVLGGGGLRGAGSAGGIDLGSILGGLLGAGRR